MKRKVFALTTAVTVAFSTSPAFALDIGYLLDLSAPSVKAFQGNKILLNQGEVGLQATITDDLSGVAQASVVFKTPKTLQNRVVTLENTSGDNWSGTLVIGASDEEGNWQVSEVTATDKAGHVAHAAVAFTVVVDKTPPNPPIVDQITDQSTKITGASNANESIAVKVDGVEIASGTTDAAGKYSITIPVQKAGTEVSVTAIDQATNESSPTKVIVKDVTKPAPPAVEATVRAGGNKAYGTTEPKATVKAIVGNNIVASATAGEDGTFTLSLPYLKEGTVVLFVAIDEAGNVSDPVSRTLVDGTPPAMPSIYTSQITDQTTSVSGSVEAGSTVKVKADGTVIFSQTLPAGTTYYSATFPKQPGGTLIEITATDSYGNESAPCKITVKSTGTATSSGPSVQVVTETSTVVKGQSQANAAITVKTVEGQVIGQGTADATGKFEVVIPVQPFNANLFISAKDSTGKVTGSTLITVKGAVKFPVKEAGATPKVFTDTESVTWAQDAISEMSTIGIIKGMSDTQFNPNGNVTRAQFASLMVRTLGLVGQGVNPFADVNANDWFAKEVGIAYKYGIITGISSNQFAPNDPITREQMATMIVRAMRVADEFKANNVNTTLQQFTDSAAIADWARESVAIASEKGLVKGMDNNLFSPNTNATRAQAAVIIYRLYHLFNN